MLDINASDETSLEETAGKWIVLLGTTAGTEDNQLSFEQASIKAQLPDGVSEVPVGQKVKVTGYLKTSTLLIVETPEDIHDGSTRNAVYTVEDEEKLRNMNKSFVTLRAKITDFTKTKTGSTLYLVFHEEGPGFRAGISPSRAEDDIDEEFLRSFVGKEIIIKGTVSTFEQAAGGRGKRLVIRFTKKSDIALADL